MGCNGPRSFRPPRVIQARAKLTRLTLAAVGRARKGPTQMLFRDYAERLHPPLHLIEVEERRPLPEAQLRAREADLLLACVPQGGIIVALDERGLELSSQGFAKQFSQWRESGSGDIVFMIGGASGHGDIVRERAHFLLSLGPMTWPHMIVRALIAEQIYRATLILAGHPYHRN